MIFNLRSNDLTQISITLFTITIITKILGLFREIVIANYFGATEELDNFLLSFTLPSAIVSILIYSIPSYIIPKLTEIKVQKSIDEFWNSSAHQKLYDFLDVPYEIDSQSMGAEMTPDQWILDYLRQPPEAGRGPGPYVRRENKITKKELHKIVQEEYKAFLTEVPE